MMWLFIWLGGAEVTAVLRLSDQPLCYKVSLTRSLEHSFLLNSPLYCFLVKMFRPLHLKSLVPTCMNQTPTRRSSRFWRSVLAVLWTLWDTKCCRLTCESFKEMALTSTQWKRWEKSLVVVFFLPSCCRFTFIFWSLLQLLETPVSLISTRS